jgi:uncharacterized repeat protein (TIGR02543 family)
VFTGWYNGNGIRLSDEENRYTVVGPVTMFAQWTVDTSVCTVTFDINYGYNTSTSITESKGTPIILPTPIRDGYVFDGWYSLRSSTPYETKFGNGGDSYTIPVNANNSITMYAHWSVACTITFISEGGSEVEPIIAGQNSAITLPTPIREGYGFAGWYSEAQGGTRYGVPYSGDNYNYTVSRTTSITMYAQWLILRTVTFDTTDGTTPTSRTVMEGSSIPLPSVTRDGYWFKGWYSEEQGGTKYEITYSGTYSYYTVTGDVTMYAQWYPIYTVTFDKTDGTTPTTRHVSEYYGPTALTISLPDLTRAGFSPNGWYSAAVGGSKYGNAGDSYTVTGDVTMYAQWTALARYTVTIDPNGAARTPAPVTEYVGTSITLPSLSRTGYTFNGWYSDAQDGTKYGNAGDSYTISGNVTMHALWTINQYTITYNANGGNVTPASQTENYNTSVTLPTPTRTEYTFNGWYSAATGGTKYGNAGDSYTISGNVTMYAQWTINRYTITYNANGGTVTPASQTVNYNTSVTLPTQTRTGYHFDGWFSAATGGTRYGTGGDSYTVTGNITLYAQWTIEYTVTFVFVDTSGNPIFPPITVVSGTSVTMPIPSYNGQIYSGWSTERYGYGQIFNPGESYVITNNLRLYSW